MSKLNVEQIKRLRKLRDQLSDRDKVNDSNSGILAYLLVLVKILLEEKVD